MRLKNPLLSLDASGSYAGTLTYRRATPYTRPTVYLSTTHADTQSPKQLTQRTCFALARTRWQTEIAPAGLSNAWHRYAANSKPKLHSGYLRYMSYATLAIATGGPAPYLTKAVWINETTIAILVNDLVTGLPLSYASDLLVRYGARPQKLNNIIRIPAPIEGMLLFSLPGAGAARYISITDQSLNVSGIIDTNEVEANAMSTVPIGAIIFSAAEGDTDCYLTADGRAVSRVDYSLLYDVIGTTYGEGDGSTTFNIPDLTGLFPRGGTPDGVTYPDTTAAPVGGLAISTAAANHSHGNTGSTGKTHTHGGTTDTANCSHSHTGTTGNANASHSHNISNIYKGTSTSHVHNAGALAQAGNDFSDRVTQATGNNSSNHKHSFTTDTSNPAHAHIVTTGNADVDHAHTTAAANASHSHSVSGWDTETAPTHMLLTPLIKYRHGIS